MGRGQKTQQPYIHTYAAKAWSVPNRTLSLPYAIHRRTSVRYSDVSSRIRTTTTTLVSEPDASFCFLSFSDSLLFCCWFVMLCSHGHVADVITQTSHRDARIINETPLKSKQQLQKATRPLGEKLIYIIYSPLCVYICCYYIERI